MKVIVGLGNKDKEYDYTYHNVGFMAIDRLAEKYNFKINKKECLSEIGMVNIKGEKCLFVKPQTYMNLSGLAVKSVMTKYKVDLDDILIIEDDVDTNLGQIRVKIKGSSGAHNGLKSIIEQVGCQNFKRIKIGIGPKPQNIDMATYVLSKFSKTSDVLKGIDKSVDAVALYIETNNIQEVMLKFNSRSEIC